MTNMTNAKKNIIETANKAVKIYRICLPIVSIASTIGPSAIGCKIADENLNIKAKTKTLIAGNKVMIIMIMTPARPIAFFSKIDAEKTVSVASVNIRPTTGIKLLVKNFAALIVIPSVTAALTPCNDITVRNIVKNPPSIKNDICFNKLANLVTLYSLFTV